MMYLLDTADTKEIKRLMDLYPIEGVTTNPSIISKARRPVGEIIKEIRYIIGNDKMLHVQTLGERAEEMVDEAVKLKEMVEGNFYIKIPVTPQGIKAISMVKKLGIKVTATAVFTQQQGLIAAKAGADFLAPYVNRLDNMSCHGVEVVSDLVHLIETYNLDAKVLAASFKNVDQVHGISMAGAHAVTVTPKLFEHLVYHPLTKQAVRDFEEDGQRYYDLGA
jgi:fructose-6-phosphate aldolase 2